MSTDSAQHWSPKHFDATYVVDGFRSLREFEVTLKTGLNVLVGVNGSGKTNFIDFLDFITSLIGNGGSAAVSAAGGVSRVFSQEALKRKIPRVVSKIIGIADLNQFIMGNTKKSLFKFEYEVDLRYSKPHSSIYIAHEKLKFKNLHQRDLCADSDTTVGSLEIYRRSPLADDEPKWTFGTYLMSNAGRNPCRFLHRHRLPPSKRRGGGDVGGVRVAALEETPNTAPDESFLSVRTMFPAVEAVREALSRGRSFNLNPHRARAPDDIATVPFIRPDGSGLSATLYQIVKSSEVDDSGGIRVASRRRFSSKDLETIVAWTQFVLPELHNITATADPNTGKYLIFLIVGDDEQNLRIPLQSASDGTLKWLAFVCLVISQGDEYTFEEPENFLHPKMQQNFIALICDAMEENPRSRFVISTHSETLINQVRPEDLILFDFTGGKTSARRISNAQSLRDEINNTGFGLGHYYVKNVVY